MRTRVPILTALLLTVLCLLSLAAPPEVSAQTRTSVTFDHALADVNLTVTYQYGYFLSPTATAPAATVDVPKAQIEINPSGIGHVGPLPRPLIGEYVVKLRAVPADPQYASDWSNASPPFVLRLEAPTAVR